MKRLSSIHFAVLCFATRTKKRASSFGETMKTFNHFIILLIFASLPVSVSSAMAQTTAFTYQGKLTDSGNLTNAAYDMQFKLFDAATNGTQIGATLTFDGNSGNPPSVSVTNGIFTVSLDFGSAALSGADRYLEIGLKPAGNPDGYQQLLPRQKLTSTPYSVQALKATTATTATNAAQLGGVAASQYVVTSDARLTDARPPLAGSANYIQNTTNQQATSNFNISGNGTAGGTLTAGIVNAVNQININGLRAFTVNGAYNDGFGTVFTATNTFTGEGTGVNTIPSGTLNDSSGKFNSFYGAGAGQANTTGGSNAFFGNQAGKRNTTGGANAYFGSGAGTANTTGDYNAFFGAVAGINNTASFNSFFGSNAGQQNQTGQDNSFFGYNAGKFTNASSNSFFGRSAGETNTTGIENAFFGYQAGLHNTTACCNTFVGTGAGLFNLTGFANSFFGHSAGYNTTSSFNAFFGRSAGADNSSGASNAFFGYNTGSNNTTGSYNTFIGTGAVQGNTTGSNNTAIGAFADVNASNLDHATAIGADSLASLSNSIYLGRPDGVDAVRIPGPTVINGSLVVGTLGSAGSTSICLNVANRIAPCSSSLRYKTHVRDFTSGLDIVSRLRPITFDWKDGSMRDVGFAAEEVQKIAPLLTTYNKDGQVEGVKYGQLTTVLVNAVKEQQTQIVGQQQTIEQLRQQVDALKKLVCLSHPRTDVCK